MTVACAVTGHAAAQNAGLPSICSTYPVVVAKDPNAKPRAVAELAELSATATLEWSDVRGTMSSLSGLQVQLSCADDELLGDAVASVVEGAEGLFQMDFREWQVPEVHCGAIQQQTYFYKAARARMGGYAVAQDTVTFIVKRIDGNMILDAVYASYLPPLSAATLDALADCESRPARDLQRAAKAHRYEYTYYAPRPAPTCQLAGVASYYVRTPDLIELETAPDVEWTEDEAEVTLRKTLRATVRVAPYHATRRLLSSNANCPDPADGAPPERQLGFRAKLDVVTGEVLESQPGVNPYCTSCLSELEGR